MLGIFKQQKEFQYGKSIKSKGEKREEVGLERGLKYTEPWGLGTKFRFYFKNSREPLEVCKQGNNMI